MLGIVSILAVVGASPLFAVLFLLTRPLCARTASAILRSKLGEDR